MYKVMRFEDFAKGCENKITSKAKINDKDWGTGIYCALGKDNFLVCESEYCELILPVSLDTVHATKTEDLVVNLCKKIVDEVGYDKLFESHMAMHKAYKPNITRNSESLPYVMTHYVLVNEGGC